MKKFLVLLMAAILLCVGAVAFADESNEDVVVGAHKHTPKYGSGKNETLSTCTVKGGKDLICDVCGEEYHEEYDLLPHTMPGDPATGDFTGAKAGSKIAKCNEEGLYIYDCTVCGNEQSYVIEKADHVTDDAKTVPANCVDGTKTYCKNCNEEFEAEDALGHTFERSGKEKVTAKVTIPSTCKELGHTATYWFCTDCGAYSVNNFTDVEKATALAKHQWAATYLVAVPQADGTVIYTGVKGLAEGENTIAAVVENSKVAIDVVNGGPAVKTQKITVLGKTTATYVAPTCEVNGSVEFYCELCETTETYTIVAPGHKYGDQPERVDATCTVGGAAHWICEECGHEYQTLVSALGHTYNTTPDTYFQKLFMDAVWKEVKAKNLVDCLDHYEVYFCTRCNAGKELKGTTGEYKWVKKDATEEHTYKNEYTFKNATIINEVAPKCEEDGNILWACGKCKTPTFEIKPATGHTWEDGDVITQPSCFEDGEREIFCACGAEDTAVMPAFGKHTSVVHIEEAGDCTKDKEGFIYEYCAACGVDIIPKKSTGFGHVADPSKPHVVVEDTCQAAGYEEFYCKKCCEGVRVDGEKKPHNFVTESVTKATCYTAKVEHQFCSFCDEPYDKIVGEPLEHVYSHYVIITKPTCDQAGEIAYECDRCELEYAREKIPAAGHSYVTEFKNGKYIYTCKFDGQANKNVDTADYYYTTFTVPNGEKIKIEVKYCGDTNDIEIHEPSYTVTYDKATGKGKIVLDKYCEPLENPWLAVYFSFTKNGEDITIILPVPVLANGTFEIPVPDASGATLDGIFIAVVDSVSAYRDPVNTLLNNYGYYED